MPVSMCKVLYIFLANANYKNIVAYVILQKDSGKGSASSELKRQAETGK